MPISAHLQFAGDVNTPSRSDRPKILSIGEVLWDLLPAGPQLGGAPANFAFHAHALGADARLVSRIGDDDRGREILVRFQSRRKPTDLIQIDPSHPTGTVQVTVGHAGQPSYQIVEAVAWDHLAATPEALSAAADARAICFGSLAQRSPASRAAIQTLVRAASEGALRVFDLNLRPPFISAEVIRESVTQANVLKLNDDELPVLAKIYGLEGDDLQLLHQLALHCRLQVIALTRGTRGSLLWLNGAISQHEGCSVDVRDTIGAGDAFTAALVMGLLAGWTPDVIAVRANEIAAFVCSQAGATPTLPSHLTTPYLSDD